MSPLTIILLVLILAIGPSFQRGVSTSNERARVFPSDRRNVSLAERTNYYTLNATGSEDPSAMEKFRLRQDLEHLMGTMVRKIIHERRSRPAKWSGTMSAAVKNNVEHKMAAGESAVGKRLVAIEASSRDGAKIGEQASMDLSRVSESLVPFIRRSLKSERRAARGNVVGRVRRNLEVKRQSEKEAWMIRDFDGHETMMKMHAFVVRDEDVPACCSPAKEVTDQRYFMCSGSILTLRHAITTASCVHYADIYEHHVDADLAILVGATSPRSYVIKINRYEMHPDYDYDVDSKNHATNNVAILYLACSIVERDAIVPKLPKGFNDDVAHMCCREGCDVVTIVQRIPNRQTAIILPAKDLPAPTHDDELPYYRQLSNTLFDESRRFDKTIFANETFPLTRRMRSPTKLAPAPIFIGRDARGSSKSQSSARLVDATNAKRRRKAKTAKISRVKNHQRERKKNKKLNLKDLTNGRRRVAARIPILRALEEEGVNVEEQLAAVDWEKIEETMSKKFTDVNREKMNKFAKSVVDETMRRLETVLDDGVVTVAGGAADGNRVGYLPGGNGSVVFDKLMPTESGRNRSIDGFVKVFTKVVASLVPPNSAVALAVSSDASVEEKDLKDPPPIHEECPPLGTPIFVGDTLVGLLAYTCDDVQPWVEWKYVNIAKNMNWIRGRTSKLFGRPEACAATEKSASQPQQRSLPDGARTTTVDEKKSIGENSTGTRSDVRAEWSVAAGPVEGRRRGESSGNVDDARIPVTETSARIPKDPWFARNSRPVAERRNGDDIFLGDSVNKPKTTVGNVPAYSVNTCYVRADGTADCLSQTDFNFNQPSTDR